MKMVELNNWKERCELSEKYQAKLIRSVLEHCDKELLISILKKRKIIIRDWEEKYEKHTMKGYPTIKELEDYNAIRKTD